ncbi:MAG: hypothetical protein M1415_00695 [Firmicutes bacterium]|nr:hypothetical protein [Bacillota bacterium]MCL5065769.1 hypothetical protein [Bacillota bacterium]
MAATHPPDYSRKSRRQTLSTEARPSRQERDRAKREHQTETIFAVIFFVIIIFTVVYLVLRSPVAHLIPHL